MMLTEELIDSSHGVCFIRFLVVRPKCDYNYKILFLIFKNCFKKFILRRPRVFLKSAGTCDCGLIALFCDLKSFAPKYRKIISRIFSCAIVERQNSRGMQDGEFVPS